MAGGRKLKAKRYPDEDTRNKFDNAEGACGSIGCIAGSIIGIIIRPYLTIEWLITVCLIGALMDNICFLFIYKKMRKEEA